MAIDLRRHREPEAMTRRARWYLGVGGTRHALIGVFAIGWAGQFASGVFIPIVSSLPMVVWGVIMLVVSASLFCAAKLRSADIARVSLVASAALTLALGVGIAAGVVSVWVQGGSATPITPILLLSLAAKDFAVCTQPLRSPFETLLSWGAPKAFQ